MPTKIEISGQSYKLDDSAVIFLNTLNENQGHNGQKSPQKNEKSENGQPLWPFEESEFKAQISKTDLARANYQIGKLYYDKADLEKAESAFLNSLGLADIMTDAFTMLKAYGFLIRIASEKLEDQKAQTFIQETERIVELLSKRLPTLNAEYFYNQGVVFNYSGKFEDAKQSFELAHKHANLENDPELLSKCLLSLATNAYYRKDFEVSLKYLDQLNDLLKILKKFYLNGAMYTYYAKVYTELNLSEKALSYYKLANEYLQSKKCWNLYGYILYGKGKVFKRAGNFEQALHTFHLTLESIDKNLFKRLTKLVHSEISDVTDSSVDLFLDRTNRKIVEKTLGTIDFKHRFVLLEILFLLSKNPGVYYDKEQLAKMIWRDEYNPLIHDKLIYTSVSRLRKLIEPSEKDHRRKYIIRGKDGYTFNPLAKIRFHMESKGGDDTTIANVDLSSPV